MVVSRFESLQTFHKFTVSSSSSSIFVDNGEECFHVNYLSRVFIAGVKKTEKLIFKNKKRKKMCLRH